MIRKVSLQKLKVDVVEHGEKFLDRMMVEHPASFALANRMVSGEMNDGGEINIKNFVMLGFGAVIVGAFVPMGLNALGAADTGNFTATELALYSIIGVAILIAVVMIFVNMAN